MIYHVNFVLIIDSVSQCFYLTDLYSSFVVVYLSDVCFGNLLKHRARTLDLLSAVSLVDIMPSFYYLVQLSESRHAIVSLLLHVYLGRVL